MDECLDLKIMRLEAENRRLQQKVVSLEMQNAADQMQHRQDNFCQQIRWQQQRDEDADATGVMCFALGAGAFAIGVGLGAILFGKEE